MISTYVSPKQRMKKQQDYISPSSQFVILLACLLACLPVHKLHHGPCQAFLAACRNQGRTSLPCLYVHQKSIFLQIRDQEVAGAVSKKRRRQLKLRVYNKTITWRPLI